MRLLRCSAALSIVLAASTPSQAEEKKATADGFVPMFNGKDLTGWVNVNCAPSTFFVKDGEIITTGKPTGYLRTEKQYENFIADFEWMHVPPKPGAVGNSGFFVWADPLPAVGTGYTRGIEVQVLVNLEKEGYYTSQGDLFSIWGATCKPDRPHPHGWARCLPSANHCKGEREWNHYIVTAKDGVIKLNVNGHEVSGVSECKPRKGYLGLESEGSECHFRNLKIKELPSTNPKPEEIANVAQGHKQLFTGLDLSGWKADDERKKHWRPSDWMLRYDGKGESLATSSQVGDGEFIVDFRFPKKDAAPCKIAFVDATNTRATFTLDPGGGFGVESRSADRVRKPGRDDPPLKGLKPLGDWNRLSLTIRKDSMFVSVNGKSAEIFSLTAPLAKHSIELSPQGAMDFGNLFVRELAK